MGLFSPSPSSASAAPQAVRSAAIHHAPPIVPTPVEHIDPAGTIQHDVVIVVSNMAERRDYWNMIERAFPGKLRVHPLLARGYGDFVANIIKDRRILVLLILEQGTLAHILDATQEMTPDKRPQVDHVVHDIERNPVDERMQRLITALQYEKKVHQVATEKRIREQLTVWMQGIMPA